MNRTGKLIDAVERWVDAIDKRDWPCADAAPQAVKDYVVLTTALVRASISGARGMEKVVEGSSGPLIAHMLGLYEGLVAVAAPMSVSFRIDRGHDIGVTEDGLVVPTARELVGDAER